jgi:hypothetical protein
MNTAHENTPENSRTTPSDELELVDESLAWDMAHAAQPFRNAAYVLQQAGIHSETARLVSKADTIANRIEREHYKALGTTKSTAYKEAVEVAEPLLAKHTLNPPTDSNDGHVPEDLLTFPTEDYQRRRWSSGGIIHNPELAETLAYVQAPYKEAQKALLDTNERRYKTWTAQEKADAKKKRILEDNSVIAVRNAELNYYTQRGTSLKAVTLATKALFLDRFWALDAQRKDALDSDTAETLDQELRALHQYAPVAGVEYYGKRNDEEKQQRASAKKAFDQEILARKEDFIKIAQDTLLVPAPKKGELPTLKLPIGLTNHIWERFMTSVGPDVSPISYEERFAVIERLGIYWNEIGFKRVTEDKLNYTPINYRGEDEKSLYHLSISAIVVGKPGHISGGAFGSYDKTSQWADYPPKMKYSSRHAKLGAAKLLTVIEEVLAEPRNEAEDAFDSQNDPELQRYDTTLQDRFYTEYLGVDDVSKEFNN